MGVVIFVLVSMAMAAGSLYADPASPLSILVDKIVLACGAVFVLFCLIRVSLRKDRFP